MPPKAKVSKEEIVHAALDVVREGGMASLNARVLSAKLQCSTQPIFSQYDAMETLKRDVMRAAYGIYEHYLKQEMQSGAYPPYKACGMGYIRFAKEEKELFRLLFMCDRSKNPSVGEERGFAEIVAMIQKANGLSYEQAQLFHLEMWIYVHGIATMLATSYLDWKWEDISRILTDAYIGLRHRFTKEGESEWMQLKQKD